MLLLCAIQILYIILLYVSCCCSPFSLVHLSLFLLPAAEFQDGIRWSAPYICQCRGMCRENEEMLNIMWYFAAVGADVEASIILDSALVGA